MFLLCIFLRCLLYVSVVCTGCFRKIFLKNEAAYVTKIWVFKRNMYQCFKANAVCFFFLLLYFKVYLWSKCYLINPTLSFRLQEKYEDLLTSAAESDCLAIMLTLGFQYSESFTQLCISVHLTLQSYITCFRSVTKQVSKPEG